jgi:signal transduction histidine kinase
LYDPASLALGQVARSTGDLSPWQSTEFESLNHTFVIATQSSPRDVWLRLTTTSTQLLHVEALSQRDMLRQEHSLWLAYSALLALIFSSLVLVLMAWLRDRDAVNGAFVMRQSVLLLYTASYLGYHRVLLADIATPALQDAFYSWLVLLTTALSYVFEYRLLSEYSMPRWGQHLLRMLLGTSGVAMLMMLSGHQAAGLQLNMLLNGAGLSVMFVISLFIQPAASNLEHPFTYQLPKFALVGYYFTVVMFLALSILPSLGVMQGGMLSIYGVLFYGLISGMFMSGLLIVRSRKIERIRQEVANKLFLSQEQLANEQKRRQDQSQLLSMLMHELKTPLSVIDMAVSSNPQDVRTTHFVNRAVENIKSILERCIQTDRMVEREFRLQSQSVCLSDQLMHWIQDRKEGATRFAIDIEPHLNVHSDLQCIEIVVNNLIGNALYHGDPQAKVQVTLHAEMAAHGRAGVLLRVSNQPGPSGRPEPDKLFAKYYRSSGAQRQSGSGLGLYLSHNLSSQLGGWLRLRPDPELICFELWLPT